MDSVLGGTWQFGIAQSDIQSDAWNGSGAWGERQENLRSVFSIHYESVTLVA
ncbi:MAG: TAXI family TRAP transporter solute-binding subunit, partial [Desulfobulbia bacterium]